MKKFLSTFLTLLTCHAVQALPVGNPSEASLLYDGLFLEGYCPDPCDPCLKWYEAISFRFGFYGDYVFNKHMEVSSGLKPDIECTEMFTNAGYLAGNLWDRFDLFITLGASSFFISTNTSSFSIDIDPPGGRLHLATDSSFSWSVGLRGTIFEFGCTSLGAEAQYFRTSPCVKRVTENASQSAYLNDTFMRYHEWQVGLGISHRINLLVPYVAVKWSGSRVNFDDDFVTGPNFTPFNLENLRSKNIWGFATGVSLVDCEKASITVEGRWGNEKAVYVNGQIRF
ncbi:MAG: hypothetical protein WAM28_03360 [Chlamydiales bacterium]